MKTLNIVLLFVISTFLFGCGKTDGFAPSLEMTNNIVISPNAVTMAVNNQITFTASGGSGSYSYSIFSGSGSVLSTTGAFTAPGVAGTTVVRVVDGAGRYADAIVTTNGALQISPTSQALTINTTQLFTASGGVSPLTYSLASGTGTINASTGLYTAPSASGTAVVRVTDAFGNVSDANVNVYSSLGISPTTANVVAGGTINFSAAGGATPYAYSVLTGGGSVNAAGVYTAPGTAGSATVRVTDNIGVTSDAFITIFDTLQISPVSQTIYTGSSINLSATGGLTPYTFSIVSGTGTLDPDLGDYTAPGVTGIVTIRVTDSIGNTSDSTITVTSTLYISPTTKILAVNNSHTFVGSGGLLPYVYSILSGGGSINSSTGAYTAPGTSGAASVRVTDALGATADATITINPALAIAPSLPTTSTATGTIYFSASGGVLPYTFSVFSGAGSINASTGVYTAPASAGTDVVRVTDSLGNTSDTNVTIITGLGINPAGITMSANSNFTFAGLNGQAPYVFSIVSGGGSINAGTGQYTAPAAPGTAVVRVTDNIGATADANVTINPVLTISPTTKTLAVNNVFTFSASGGVTPYTYSIFSGGGSVNASTGQYTAPAAAGSATVRVTDFNGVTADSAVTINAVLAISPTPSTITVVDTKSYSASGGVSPYTYSVISGPGSINSGTGLYTAATAGTITVRVTDSLTNTSDATLYVNQALSVSPTSTYMTTDNDLALIASGGVQPYTYSIVAGAGTIDSASGIYTSASTTGSATLRTTDALGHTADTAVTIYSPLVLTPLTLSIGINLTQTFTGSGGFGALSYSVFNGTGTIDPSTGLYTAPAGASIDTVRVTDSIGNTVDATVDVVSSLTISPTLINLPVFSTTIFSAVLGTPAYTYSVFAGAGSINPSTGVYTAASTAGTGTARVTDSALSTSDATVNHIEPVEISSGSYHSCVRYNTGAVKCFGDGAFGQLGTGSTADLGDNATEIGGAIPFVNLGTGRTATALASGISHTCALLDNSQMKCWGYNLYGQLGIGNTANKGDNAGEMGDALAAVNLGTGRTAVQIFAHGYVTCANLDNNTTKCWGRNTYGQLGLGNTTHRGTSIAQMGDALAAVNFGTGRTAVKLSGGLDFTCALLDNSTVKCFGRSNNGQLGYENLNSIGDGAGEMGDALAAVNLGTGRTVLKLSAGYDHVCAILDNSSIKCWGRNSSGQLGQGSTSTRGDGVGEMGDALAVTPLSSFTPVEIKSGRRWACAINASSAVRCWGQNTNGQLLVGSTTNLGDATGEVAALADINFGTGIVISNYNFGYYTGCGIFDNKRIKCWGSAANGALLNASTASHLGDAGGELGDGLPWVNH